MSPSSRSTPYRLPQQPTRRSPIAWRSWRGRRRFMFWRVPRSAASPTIDAVGGKPYLSSAPFRRIRASNSCPFPSAFPSKRPICRPVSDSATIPISFNLAAATSMVLLAARGDPPSAERVAHFVEVLFPRFAELQVPERHPKWREVNLAASLPGFSRTEAAAAWLNARAAETGTKPIVANAGAVQPASVPEAAMTKGDQEALFKRFIGWRRSKDH
jgi:hypothetical protein